MSPVSVVSARFNQNWIFLDWI